MCTEHKSKELELFCADHDLPCCATCVSVNHRKCENVLTIDDAAKKFRETTSVDQIKIDVTTLLADMEIILQSERKSLDKVQESAILQLNTYNEFWTELEQKIVKMKQNQTKQYQVQFDTEKSKLQSSINSLENKRKTVTNTRQILEVAEREASNVQVMIEVQKIKGQIDQCKLELQRKSDICEIEFQFTKDVDEVDNMLEKVCILNCNRLNTDNVSSLKSEEKFDHSCSSELEIDSGIDQEREYNWQLGNDQLQLENIASQHKMMPDWREQNVVTMQEETVQELQQERIHGWQNETVVTREKEMVKDWLDEPVECKHDYIANKQPKKVHESRAKSVATRQQEMETTRKTDNWSEWQIQKKTNMQLERVRDWQMETVPTGEIEVECDWQDEPVIWEPDVAANQSKKVHESPPVSVVTRQQDTVTIMKTDNASEWQQQKKTTFQPDTERQWRREAIQTEKMEVGHAWSDKLDKVEKVNVDDKQQQKVYQWQHDYIVNRLPEKEGPQEYIHDWQQNKVGQRSYGERKFGRKESSDKMEKKSKKKM